MEKTAESTLTPSARTIQMVARTLRHEVGDLLQTVYSSIAIMRSRLPAGAENERRLLADLHAQAEACKFKLDAVQDLTCPIKLNVGPINLADVVLGLTARIGPRFAHVQLHAETPQALPLVADGQRLGQVGHMLLVNACQAARREVRVRVGRDADGRVEWAISDDGPGANEEQMTWLTDPFTTTHFAQFGLGLALARRVTELHGGALAAGNLPAGGFRVALTLPPGAA